MKKIFAILTMVLVSIIFINDLNAQRRTSVKGYYRKDGTYVRPHTRSVPGSSSKSTNYSSYNSTNGTSSAKDYADAVEPSSLTLAYNEGFENEESINSENTLLEIQVSVLRYNGKVIDIAPIHRSYGGELDNSIVYHTFDRNSISAEDALELVSNHGWSVSGSRMNKAFHSFIKDTQPKFITLKQEKIFLIDKSSN